MRYISRLISKILLLLLYWVGKLVPRNRDVWVFGAWFGKKYADNPKYLFEYMNRCHPEITSIWLTRDRNALALIRKKGYSAYLTHSVQGLYYTLVSMVDVIAVSSLSDTHALGRQKVTANLWHGIPLKKIVHDDRITSTSHAGGLPKAIKEIIFPFLSDDYSNHLLFVSSDVEAEKFSSAFRAKSSSIFVTGSPRLDAFFHQASKTEKGAPLKVLYMPTHRGEGGLNISKVLLSSISEISQELVRNNVVLYVKLHFYHLSEDIKDLKAENVVFVGDDEIEQDIYTILPGMDILITDYSSVFFDFTLADKPIIFAPFDFEDYLKKDRELYFDYDEVTPGPKCRDWKEVMEWIVKLSSDPLLFATERAMVRNMFHKYQDGNNCSRVYSTILAHLDARG